MSKQVTYNKSKTYLLPLLSEFLPFEKEFISCMPNTYMYDDIGKYKNHFFVLHDFTDAPMGFADYEKKLTSSDLFVDFIDIDNKVLYIFKFPEEYLHEYNCLSEGRYSAFGIGCKELILKFWGTIHKNNAATINALLKVKQILFKDKKLKEQLEQELSSEGTNLVPGHQVKIDDDAELGQLLDIDDETFELSKYIDKNENKV